MPRPGRVLVAGAGIAGLTAGLAFAACGFEVEIFERSIEPRTEGAGIQLSPNATRILRRFGVLERLEQAAVRPSAVILRNARSLSEIARVPLGADAENRWGAPYLVLHRRDLVAGLLEAVRLKPSIKLSFGSAVSSYSSDRNGVRLTLEETPAGREIHGALLIGAGGVWSTLQSPVGKSAESAFTGEIAWRRTIPAHAKTGCVPIPTDSVNAYLSPRFHLVTYPISGGAEINLVGFATGKTSTEDWSGAACDVHFASAFGDIAPPLKQLFAEPQSWRSYPIHTVGSGRKWTAGGVVLIGDAAHAMTPYAAQGAAMAIEDAESLAAAVADAGPGVVDSAISRWEAVRRDRIARVRRRGALNKFAWHASGPAALVRNAVLALRAPESLAADMDWLYGYDAGGSPA